MTLLPNNSFPVFHTAFVGTFLLMLTAISGCTTVQIYQEIPPSSQALTDVSAFHADRFRGEHSTLFRSFLIREIYRLPHLNYLEDYPDASNSQAALLDAEVRIYSVRDEEEQRPQTQIRLVQHRMRQKQQSGRSLARRAFEFVETPFTERWIHRTLDLEIEFTVKTVAGGEVLSSNTEKAGFQQSYAGEESILLIPEADDEMARLGQLLIQNFLERISPVVKQQILELEKGTAPLPWTAGMLDFGHPGIRRANRYAAAQRYDLALKGWNYVLFEPRTYHKSERFIFTNHVFTSLKKAHLPRTAMHPLLKLYGQSFEPDEIDTVLLRLIPRQDFQRYGRIIKSHARSGESLDRLNLAATHYNLGVVYHLQNDLELAAYHFAQANAYRPHEKYAQAWTDVQHRMGDYNPLDTLMERTIEAAGKRRPPKGALLQPKTELVSTTGQPTSLPQTDSSVLQPVELAPLANQIRPQVVPPAEISPESEAPQPESPETLTPLELD